MSGVKTDARNLPLFQNKILVEYFISYEHNPEAHYGHPDESDASHAQAEGRGHLSEIAGDPHAASRLGMTSRRDDNWNLMKKIFLSIALFLISCSSTGYYPTREIARAEAAVAAAKEVHAERLASDKYQFAVESLGRAKAYEKQGRYSASKRAARAAIEYAEEAEEIAVQKLIQVPGAAETPETPATTGSGESK